MEEKLMDFNSYAIRSTLKRILKDKSTKKNIIWATNTYTNLGPAFDDKNEISYKLIKNGFVIKPRTSKSNEDQLERTKQKAEVFTPSWIVNHMNNICDEQWFGRRNVFNTEKEKSWEPIEDKISFPIGKTWKDYIDSTRLEITCGEAPFLVSRYDVATGEYVSPTILRIGILDRKLRIVNENTQTKEDWIKWAIRAVESCYGYEYQGDNLLLARINILLSFAEYFEERWGEEVANPILLKLSNIISWNLWQMDGLTDIVPFGAPAEDSNQLSLFDLEEIVEDKEREPIPSRIYNWRSKRSLRFMDMKENKVKKFDFVIGNPPYQDTFIGDSTQAPPVYHLFVEEAKEISDKILLITPARFLFNAGATPKAWNEKMLNYDHIKVMKYEQKSASIFPNTDIKGGVTIFYIDKLKKYNPIKVFTSFNELNSIIQKMNRFNYQSLSTIMYGQNTYKFSEKVHEDYKDIEEKLSKGHKYDLTTSIFDKLPEIFLDDVDNKEDYMQIIGRSNGKRVYKWIKRAYIRPNDTLLKYKVILPKSNGSGAIGEVLSTPLIGEPLIGYTQTFISIGLFDNYIETENCLKYIKTKFARTMLGVLKITQDNPPAKWKYVPLQDFTESSDIDRSKSIPEIDRQLYKKYGLNEEEISFIEEKVQEME